MAKKVAQFLFGKQVSDAVVDNLEVAFAESGLRMDPAFIDKMTEAMHRAKVNVEDDKEVFRFIAQEKDFMQQLQEEHTYPLPIVREGFEGELHDGLIEAVRKSGSRSDAFIWVALQVYGGKSAEHAVFASNIATAFDHNKQAFGEYVRTHLNVEKKRFTFRQAAMTTSDSVRVAGDATEKVITATAKAVNKYAFQSTAAGIDKVTGRPEELKGVNVVKQGMSHPFKKEAIGDIAARLVEENKQSKKKSKKK